MEIANYHLLRFLFAPLKITRYRHAIIDVTPAIYRFDEFSFHMYVWAYCNINSGSAVYRNVSSMET